jgi:hypothetical protein
MVIDERVFDDISEVEETMRDIERMDIIQNTRCQN